MPEHQLENGAKASRPVRKLHNSQWLTLKEIEGPSTTHDAYLKREIAHRQGALEYADDLTGLATYVGGEVMTPQWGADWVMRKELFPGVAVLYLYTRGDNEFPALLRVLYSGDRVRNVTGEDLAALTISGINHMLRFVRDTYQGKPLPEICHRV
ncbi:MAG: DUF3786 domain-containing protein [Chloroflexota bacterium]